MRRAGIRASARDRSVTPAETSPRAEAVQPAAARLVGGAPRELAPSLVERPELGEVAMRLLEVPADDLRVLGRAIAGVFARASRRTVRAGPRATPWRARRRRRPGSGDGETRRRPRLPKSDRPGRTSSLRTSSRRSDWDAARQRRRTRAPRGRRRRRPGPSRQPGRAPRARRHRGARDAPRGARGYRAGR